MTIRPERAELAAHLALLASGRATASRALELTTRAGSALGALTLVRDELPEQVWARLTSEQTRERVRRALHTIMRDDIAVIPHGDSRYPQRLGDRLAGNAPAVLFAVGNAALLHHEPAVAIVGSRNATVYGRDVAELIGGAVARAGGCVVSGMARGVDGAAHRATLEADGATIGVLGCGVDVIYPHEHDQLHRQVAACGLLLSEQLPGEPPKRHTFTYRNRIIAALADAVVVVEAARRSGAIATANHAADAGVRVYGVPNALHAETSEGVLGLFRDGATVFTGIRDFLEDMSLLRIGQEVPEPVQMELYEGQDGSPPDGIHGRVWVVLGRGPMHVDSIATRAALDAREALAALLELELDGRVEQHAGQRFARTRPRPKPAKPAKRAAPAQAAG